MTKLTISPIVAWKPTFTAWLNSSTNMHITELWRQLSNMILMAQREETPDTIAKTIQECVDEYTNHLSLAKEVVIFDMPLAEVVDHEPVGQQPSVDHLIEEPSATTDSPLLTPKEVAILDMALTKADSSDENSPEATIARVNYHHDAAAMAELKRYSNITNSYIDDLAKYPRKIILEYRYSFKTNTYNPFLIIDAPSSPTILEINAVSLNLLPGLTPEEIETICMVNGALSENGHALLTADEQKFLLNPIKYIADKEKFDLDKLKTLCGYKMQSTNA